MGSVKKFSIQYFVSEKTLTVFVHSPRKTVELFFKCQFPSFSQVFILYSLVYQEVLIILDLFYD